MRERVRQVDRQLAARCALVGPDLFNHLIDAIERLGDDRQKPPTGFRQAQLMRLALEELHADQIFEPDHMPADRRLRDEERRGGCGEARVPAGGLECPSALSGNQRRSIERFSVCVGDDGVADL